MKKHLQSILALVITLLILGTGILAWWLQGRIEGTLDRRESLLMDQENQARQLAKLPELGKDYEDIQARRSALDIVYPESRVVEAIQSIETLAKAEAVDIVIEELDKPVVKKERAKANDAEEAGASPKDEAQARILLEKPPFEKSLYLQVSTEGSYEATFRFLRKLETTPFALDVTAIELGVLDEESGRVTAPGNDNPFLLTQTDETNIPEAQTGKVGGRINILLYVQ